MRRHGAAHRLTTWERAVGPQIAAVAKHWGAAVDGVVTVRVGDVTWLAELELMAPRLVERLQGEGVAVARIRWIIR